MTALSDEEWASAVHDWPLLNGYRADCIKLGPATPRGSIPYYNCIGWSMGYFRWIDCPPYFKHFVQLYEENHLVPCAESDATVDGWGANKGNMLHASKRIGHTWTSKLGEWIKMTHPREKLEGNAYGSILVHFRPRTELSGTSRPLAEVEIPPIDRDALAKVTNLIDRTAQNYPALVDDFETNWNAWTSTFDDERLQICQSSDDFAKGPAYDALAAMGPKILPQVVKKLEASENIFGCNLYNLLQSDPAKKVDPESVMDFYDLENQARLIVGLYASQMNDFDKLAADWSAAQDAVKISSSSHTRTSGPAYEALCNLGGPAIPLIMDRYTEEKTGWWSELLHEIVYGERSGIEAFDFEALYQKWSNWYQGR